MKKARFTDEQIVATLRDAQATSVVAAVRKHGVSEGSIHRWRKQCAGLVDEQVWQVSFLEYDLGFFDKDEDRIEPGPNPIAPDKVLTMCPE